jgi:hypothetical protein
MPFADRGILKSSAKSQLKASWFNKNAKFSKFGVSLMLADFFVNSLGVCVNWMLTVLVFVLTEWMSIYTDL